MMIPRLDIRFSLIRQWQYWFGKEYKPQKGEYLLDYARSGIVLALKAALPNGGRVGIVSYNCHTVMNAVTSAGCTPVFLDVDNELRIDCGQCTYTVDDAQCTMHNLDAIVVTNLFGIHNDIEAIRKACPKAVIIVDNAHGYGLPPEGDFTVYSINQGKYPALGPGGILMVDDARCTMHDVVDGGQSFDKLRTSSTIHNIVDGGQSFDKLRTSSTMHDYGSAIDEEYRKLKGYGFGGQVKMFIMMMIKAVMYHPWVYGWLTMRLKAGRSNGADHTPIVPKKMCPGVSRMYNAWVKEHEGQNVAKPFMDVIHTDNPQKVIEEYRAKGIEAETHFKNWMMWAKEFGYKVGSCPNAERLVNHLVMVPNYWK